MLVIGVTGPACGGKGTVAHFLESKGYTYFSLSDILRGEATSRGLSHDRKVLQDLGDSLRAKHGSEFLAVLLAQIPEFSVSKMAVVDAIRHPAEIRFLKDFYDAKVVGVTLSPEKNFELIQKRARPGDPTTYEEFLEMQKREMGKENSPGMQVHKCLEMADKILTNNRSETDLTREAEVVFSEMGLIENVIKRERG